ncbi:MAG TPA: hypothetical protein VLL97_06220 [Acidobacteriota bacterium]|nr:hypothetical protein [Acidobacteriota bacterium]
MAEKLSKTARASLGNKKESQSLACPQCGASMIATKVIKYRDMPGGMFWVCPKDDNRVKI